MGSWRRGRWLIAGGAALAVAVGAGAVAYFVRSGPEPEPVRAALVLAEVLGGRGQDGFVRAVAPRPFVFPGDHGPHPGFRTEWWYYTGNLETASGRHVGFQLTFFRLGLTPRPAARASEWAARDVYMAHFAVTDTATGRFHASERFARAALDLAGARAEPFRVWLEDWSAAAEGPGALPMRLRAADGPVAIDLTLESAKPAVLHGEAGLSRKSAEPGNASYYFSLTRMPARGTVRFGSELLAVEGLAWMDREWSTSALAPDQVGWDWFAFQLEDGREIMLYRLRRRDGTVDPASAGTVVGSDGAAHPLAAAAFEVETLATWESPRDGSRYPARWRVSIPAAGLDLDVAPALADQELDLAVRYWEGAVRLRGTADGQPVTGLGYVELTGYAGEPPGNRERPADRRPRGVRQ